MTRRPDVMALVVGLALLVVAALGMWLSFGVINRAWIGVGIPVMLVVVGLLGLTVSRTRT